MENKINIAEILENCPQGMELYSPIFGTVYFDGVKDTGRAILVNVRTSCNSIHQFYADGKYNTYYSDSECLLFPSKEQRDWSKFRRPFKDGDILSNKYGKPFILKAYLPEIDNVWSYCGIDCSDVFKTSSDRWTYANSVRFATEEEKEILFQAIKDNGYKWNAETKTLEKLPKFKVGEYIVNDYCMGKVIALTNDAYLLDTEQGIPFSCEHNVRHWTIQDAKNGDVLYHSDSASNGIFIFKELLEYEFEKKVICYCDYDSEDGFCLGESHTCCWADAKILHPATKEQCNLLFKKIKEAGYKWNPKTKTLDEVVKPNFKVGDRIRHKASSKISKIIDIRDDSYITGNVTGNVTVGSIPFSVAESDFELITKFDISTLIPFESRVLVRDDNNECWIPAIWAFKKENKDDIYPFVVVGGNDFVCCIPYDDNQHLIGKTVSCDEFYKTWE